MTFRLHKKGEHAVPSKLAKIELFMETLWGKACIRSTLLARAHARKKKMMREKNF